MSMYNGRSSNYKGTNDLLLTLNCRWQDYVYKLEPMKDGWERIYVHYYGVYLGRIALLQGKVYSVKSHAWAGDDDPVVEPLTFVKKHIGNYMQEYKGTKLNEDTNRKEESMKNPISRIEKPLETIGYRDAYVLVQDSGLKQLIEKELEVEIKFKTTGRVFNGVVSSHSVNNDMANAQFFVRVELEVVPPPPKEMTMYELEKALGYKVKVVESHIIPGRSP